MKIALATTTIHLPHALKALRRCSRTVRFFVAADKKTPVIDHGELNVSDMFYLAGGDWKCSEAIGWNTIARRNIAFLEALKWGADVIYSHDDDNLAVDHKHFRHLRTIFGDPAFTGLMLSGINGWLDPGNLLIPQTRHRGYPSGIKSTGSASPVADARIGVAAGLVLGDPDIDAVTRIANSPDVQSVTQLGQSGVVVDPHTWTVFNTQNTAVIRELVPAWFLMPNVGRHDDIYAALIVQRVARERGYHVHFGLPFTYQQRNQHDLIKDLRAEIDGMENVTKLADLLDSIVLPARNVIEDVRIIYQQLTHCSFIPEASARAGLVWLKDCEGVL